MANEKNLKSSASLWEVNSENANAPVLRGQIELRPEDVLALAELVGNGEKAVLSLALWDNVSDNERAPVLKGTLELPQERETKPKAVKVNRERTLEHTVRTGRRSL
jgi:hypothetical protein